MVSDIEVEDYEGDIRTTDSFRNSFSTHQLFKIANNPGVGMLKILKSVKEDTSRIPEIVKNTALIPEISKKYCTHT